jgi:ribosomal protein S15P/S13E
MPRLTLRIDTIRALFALSGNQCAFPGCTQPLINEKNQFIGQICHIEAALPGAERYNPNQSDEERSGHENLILFCYPHHVETNDVSEYTVEKLKAVKREHEAKFEKSDFKIDEVALYKVMSEMDHYWAQIEKLNALQHSLSEFAVDVKAKISFFDIIKSCRENIGYLSDFHDTFRRSDERLPEDFNNMLRRKGIDPKVFDDIPYYENPFQNRNWEFHILGIHNRMQQLQIDLMHMEIKYLEEFLKTNSKDKQARERLDTLKKAFAKFIQKARIMD